MAKHFSLPLNSFSTTVLEQSRVVFTVMMLLIGTIDHAIPRHMCILLRALACSSIYISFWWFLSSGQHEYLYELWNCKLNCDWNVVQAALRWPVLIAEHIHMRLVLDL